MRTFAIARTSAQWSKIRTDLAMLLQDSPELVEPETKQLLDDILEVLTADADRTAVPNLPTGVIGNVQHGKALEERLFAQRFPSRVGVESTHYEDCYRGHPECAYALGVFDTLAAATNAPLTPRKEP